ncbi:hypothetical protein [Sinorhizobium medicae]|uniref:hypothetical protein n=1 Tax=Sinorhizobium medicae TaxID=110321 RepID=UPI000FDC620F|nr:hypothetical protein [Sinorhizobium medicae]RVP48883.1 hypothetical protein CN078_24060 [Sinorhizobium medicae]RVP73671.1 hypothetical protein CN079_23810 [Sinorhizobium medicae]UWU12413.1 hypothetical protein N2598_30240 [Sinorhizobium medicae]
MALETWLRAHEQTVSLASYIIGLCSVLTAVGSLIYNMRNNTRTRNFNNVVSLQGLIRDEKEQFHAVAAIRPRDQKKYKVAAAHYFNILELAAFALNHKFIGGGSGDYLAGWLKDELDGIYGSATQGAVMNELRQVSDPPFGEIYQFHPPEGPLPPKLSLRPRYAPDLSGRLGPF